MNDITKWFLLALMILGLYTCTADSSDEMAYVSICFDDAHNSVYGMALPTLQQYGLAATVYVPTIGIGDKPFWHMSWDQIAALQKAGWEIGSHSHTHKSMLNFSPEEVDEELSVSKNILTKHGLSISTFAAPFGAVNDAIVQSIKKYYIAQRGIERNQTDRLVDSLNDLDVDPYHIAAIQLHYDFTSERIEYLVDKAVIGKKWIVFYLHAVVDGTPEDPEYKFSLHKLSLLAAYLSNYQKKGLIRVVTIREFIMDREAKHK